MDTKTKLIAAAERLFDTNGFTATGMDRLTEAAAMSSRTLYKHASSKTDLIVAVLNERDRRFMRQIDVSTVEALFRALENWIRTEGARGCLFLRALGETGGTQPKIAEMVASHKQGVHLLVAEIVATEIGRDDKALTEQVLVLFEGAVAASIYRGQAAVRAAGSAATQLVTAARRS